MHGWVHDELTLWILEWWPWFFVWWTLFIAGGYFAVSRLTSLHRKKGRLNERSMASSGRVSQSPKHTRRFPRSRIPYRADAGLREPRGSP